MGRKVEKPQKRGRRGCCAVLAEICAGGWLMSNRDLHDRNGMVNISPIGRNASGQERLEYEKYDAQHQIRSKFVTALKEKFADYGLTYVILMLPVIFLLLRPSARPPVRPPPFRFFLRSLESSYYHLVTMSFSLPLCHFCSAHVFFPLPPSLIHFDFDRLVSIHPLSSTPTPLSKTRLM